MEADRESLIQTLDLVRIFLKNQEFCGGSLCTSCNETRKTLLVKLSILCWEEKTMKKLDWNRATQEVIDFLQAELRADGKKDVTTKIYRWDETNSTRESILGPRIAEVDFSMGNSGGSFMQVDLPHGAAACLCAERLIIAYAEGDWGEDLFDEEWRLCMALFDHGPMTKVAPLGD